MFSVHCDEGKYIKYNMLFFTSSYNIIMKHLNNRENRIKGNGLTKTS